MNDLPPELIPKRDAIHDRVIKRGRARRLQRRVAVAFAIAIVVGLPVTAVALNGRDDGAHQVQAVAPRDEITPTTRAEPSTTESTTPTTPETAVGPAPTPSVPLPTTTTLVCRNSTDPACGPFSYDPPLSNEPATMTIAVEPPRPRPGQKVTFTMHVTDPDSYVYPGAFCGMASYGDDKSDGCIADCVGFGPRYGPWTPEPPQPGDVTYTLHHTYEKTGTFTAQFSTEAPGQCHERPSKAEASATVHVSP